MLCEDGAKRPPLSLGWRLFALLSAVLDPLWGLLACVPNVVAGSGVDPRWSTPRRRRRGLILIFGGIEGPSVYQRCMAVGLLRGGWRGAIEVAAWNRGIPFFRALPNLMSRARHERESDACARRIAEYRREHPAGPVGLLAMSGGCWIAVRTLEKLPRDMKVRSVVLLAAAISPRADLSVAAARAQNGLTCVCGPGDAFFLGVGTTLLGSSDRWHGPSAGWIGWRNPARGVVERRWRPEWIRLGYLGNHTSAASPRFIAQVVTPLFRGEAVEGRSV